MSNKPIPTDDYERVDKSLRGRPIGTEENPAVSLIITKDPYVYLGAFAYRAMGEPNYVCFFKSDTCVLMQPRDEEAGLNPHKVGENHSVSFGWYHEEVEGYCSIYYDEEQELWWFDTAERVDDPEGLHD